MNVELLTTPEELEPLLPEIVEVYRDGFETSQAEADRFGTDQMADRAGARWPMSTKTRS